MLPWFQQPEAQVILNRLKPSDLDIVLIRASGLGDRGKPDHFEWSINDEIVDKRLDLFIERATDDEVGYRFGDTNDPDNRLRWIEAFERVPSVQAVLNTKFGDPNALFGYGLETARRIWEHDPHHLIRQREYDKALAEVQESLSSDGGNDELDR